MRIAVALIVCCAACQAAGPRSGTLRTDQFDDIPVPSGAAYRISGAESYCYRTETFRCGRFVYDYPGRPEQARDYFTSAMVRPPYSWGLTEDKKAGNGAFRLVFTKNDERCTVDLTGAADDSTDDGGASVIHVRLNQPPMARPT